MPIRLFNDGMPDEPVTTHTSATATTVTAHGISILSCSSAARTFAIAAPKVGITKRIIQTATTTLGLKITTGSTATATFNGTQHILTFDALGDSIHLVGLSATRWGIISNNAVGVATV